MTSSDCDSCSWDSRAFLSRGYARGAFDIPVFYVYFKAGVCKRFAFLDDFYLTPSVYVEGGSSRNYNRAIGTRPDGERWHAGVSSVTLRLELGWTVCENVSAFVFAEQYEVVGQAARHAVGGSSYRCAHKDWTHGGVGCRIRF